MTGLDDNRLMYLRFYAVNICFICGYVVGFSIYLHIDNMNCFIYLTLKCMFDLSATVLPPKSFKKVNTVQVEDYVFFHD